MIRNQLIFRQKGNSIKFGLIINKVTQIYKDAWAEELKIDVRVGVDVMPEIIRKMIFNKIWKDEQRYEE